MDNSLKIKKNNTLTDGYLPISAGKAILPDKLINALYWKFEKEGTSFKISMNELRELLGLKHGKDDERIYKAILILQTPMQVRDFSFKGEDIAWLSAPFLNRALKRKEGQNFIDITLDDMMIEALKQKIGYTAIDINICNKFKTKYGLKIYEMFLRYYRLPNREGKEVGTIRKDFESLNNKFCTNHKHPSKMMEGINRGILEIEKITDEMLNCFYHKAEKKFVFSWHQKAKYQKLRIPFNRIDEFLDYYLEHQKDLKINSMLKYKSGLKQKIIEDKFNDLDKFYRGMLQWKYNLDPSDYFDKKSGKYQDF